MSDKLAYMNQKRRKESETHEPPCAIHGLPLTLCCVSTLLIDSVRDTLEEELQRKLNLPGRVVRIGHHHLAERRTYRASSDGFSGKPATTGWDPARIACAWVVLMKRLGYAQFVAQGSPMSPSSFSGKSWAGNRFSIANLRPSGSKKLYQFFSYVPFLFGEAVL